MQYCLCGTVTAGNPRTGHVADTQIHGTADVAYGYGCIRLGWVGGDGLSVFIAES